VIGFTKTHHPSTMKRFSMRQLLMTLAALHRWP